jgi:hypothetical protein
LEAKVTKEEIITAVLTWVEQTKRVPSRTELLKLAGLRRRDITLHFGTYGKVLEECGLEKRNKNIAMEVLFEDWAGVARRLGKVPSQLKYAQLSKFSVRPLLRWCKTWKQVPHLMKLHLEERGWTEEHKDILRMIGEWNCDRKEKPAVPGPPSAPPVMKDRPTYGPRITGCPLVFAPTNEAGVLYLFGAVSERLGFLALHIQTEFPDCEAMRVVEGNRLQRVRIELEYESRNFLRHGHLPELRAAVSLHGSEIRESSPAT